MSAITTVFIEPGDRPFACVMQIQGKPAVSIRLDRSNHSVMLAERLTDAQKDAWLEELIGQLQMVRMSLQMQVAEATP